MSELEHLNSCWILIRIAPVSLEADHPLKLCFRPFTQRSRLDLPRHISSLTDLRCTCHLETQHSVTRDGTLATPPRCARPYNYPRDDVGFLTGPGDSSLRSSRALFFLSGF